MKKRTKEILAGALALCILLSTPVCVEAVAAVGRLSMDREWKAVFQKKLPPEDSPETNPYDMIKVLSEELSEEVSEEITESSSAVSSEELSEEETESCSEELSEEVSEEQTEGCSEELSEKVSEEQTENSSEVLSEETPEDRSESLSEESEETLETSPESILEEFAEIETYLNHNPDNDPVDKEEWVEIPVSYFFPEISDDGELDYRTYIDNGDEILIKVPKSEADQTGVKSIKVKNCALEDSDFYIELTRDGQIQQYSYQEWLDYLKGCSGWVNDKVEVRLSDTGNNYFQGIKMEEQNRSDGKKNYKFWAENPDRNVSTKGVENGTRSYTLGIDTHAPVLKDICTDSVCYEPTKTDTEQYFAEDFILKGSFCDEDSGVRRIEYTTDLRAEKNAVWTEAEIIRPSIVAQETRSTEVDFQITLADGCYPAIAVRAYDEAGNASEIKQFVNDAGEPIQVIVDRTAPVLTFNTTADGQPYSGEKDHWTNKDVQIQIAPDKKSSSYAGLYQCEYTYKRIGENMTDVPENWTELPVQDKSLAVLDITEDKNGYFLFRAVSKSGVETKEYGKQRILIQHQGAEPKPLIVSGVDETKCRDGWYNKQSGAPVIHFEYPEYDTGTKSKEYDAPITIHYTLTRSDSAPEVPEPAAPDEADRHQTAESDEKSAVIGVMSSEDMTICADGSKEFVLTKDDLNQYRIEFGYDDGTKDVQDGFYTLEYWITDKAGNVSKTQRYSYKIDCHEPTDLSMELDGSAFLVGKESVITYDRFYQDTISGSAYAQYGISGKGSLTISKVKKIGEWNDMGSGSFENADNFSIEPNTRCFLYIRAEDAAGNTAEGWTSGIAVDNMAPNEAGSGNDKELIIEPRGANEHGFFQDDILIDISIKDAPEDDNCAALKTITGSVGRDGMDTIADKEFFTFTKESPTEDEIVAASSFQGTQLIDARANESNEAYIEVIATDRSGNTKISTQLLKIDVTKPEIDIRFDNNEAENGNYYNQKRTATIHVHERNFDPDGVSVSATRDGQPYETSLSAWMSDGSDHYATLTFAEDGEYSIRAYCVDLADNISDEVLSETFIIDCTAPEVTIALAAGQDAQNAGQDFFNTGVTAVITVTERNFRAEDFAANMTPVSEKGTWSHEGDIHTLRILFADDNAYHIDCAYTDMAGNPSNSVEKEFVIDTIAPAVVIEGVGNNSANSGEILPVISVSDLNIEQSKISVSVTTGIGGVVENAVATEFVSDDAGSKYRMTLPDMTKKPDNIYYLTAAACDKAGNEAKCTYRFSLNRNGSVYDLTELMQLMEKQYNTYDGLCDIPVLEMNVDTVEEFELYVSRNGAIGFEAEYTREVSGSADTGYTYMYQIKKENFAEEGIYRLSLYSRDRAGNEVNNVSNIQGKEISFVIDNTAPKVLIDGVRPGMVYDVEEQEVHVSITDNFKLAEAELTLVNRANEVLKTWDYMELAGEGEELTITIPQCSEAMSLQYRAEDAAGNEIRTALTDFLVTTDKLVQFVNKPSKTLTGHLMIAITGGAGAIGLSAAAASGIRKRKKRVTVQPRTSNCAAKSVRKRGD